MGRIRTLAPHPPPLFEIRDIVWDLSLYPREAGPDWHTIADIVSAIRTKVRMPPPALATVNQKLIIVDGWHRIKAFQRLKMQTVRCEYLGEMDSISAFAEAARRNMSHGRKLSWHERLLIYYRLRDANWSLEKIEDVIHVPAGQIKRLAAGQIIKAGDERVVLKSAIKNLAMDGKTHTAREMDAQSIFAAGDQLKLIQELTMLIEKKWLNIRDKKIQNATRKLYLLLRPLVKQEIHV